MEGEGRKLEKIALTYIHYAGRVRERMRHRLSWQSLPTDVHLGFGVVVTVYSRDVKEYHRACSQTVWL